MSTNILLLLLLPTGEVGFMVTSHWGSWFQGYSLLGERVGCMGTPPGGEGGLHGFFLLGKLVYGYFPLGKLVSGLLPAGGEGGLHGYSLLGGEGGLRGYFLLGKLLLWLLTAGEVGFMVTPRWGRGWVA